MPRKSFCALFLTISRYARSDDIGFLLSDLWNMLENLKKGITTDLVVNKRNLKPGSLTMLLGYGHSSFAVDGAKRTVPGGLSNKFLSPDYSGGGPITEGSELRFNSEIVDNHASSDHLLIQFTGENEFITNRAVVETWKRLRTFSKGSETLVSISRIYSGFLSDDGRNWMGFHDGISNVKPTKRRGTIMIGRSDVSNRNEEWLMNGTYMAFLRIEINLKAWNALTKNDQELIIGRDKMTGCPLIAIDNTGKPVKERSCPVPGTFEVIEPGNERFRDHPPFGNQRYLAHGFDDSILKNSHIGKALDYNAANKQKPESFMIYRQGYNFYEPNPGKEAFKLGLNFISFQKDPQRLFTILRSRSPDPMQDGQEKAIQSLEKYVYVNSAGIFFVPPERNTEPFPGASIFLDLKS